MYSINKNLTIIIKMSTGIHVQCNYVYIGVGVHC